MSEEKKLAFNAELSEMDLAQVNARLAADEVEVRESEDLDLIAEKTEQKAMLLERKAELEDLENRKAAADALEGAALGKSIEKKGNEMEEKFTTASPEYRSAFFKQLLNQPLTEVEERAIVQSGGNGVIPVQTANELVHRMKEVAPLLSEITLSRVAGMVTVGTLLEPDDAYLHAEGATITASNDTLAYVTLGGYEFAKIVPVSKSMQAMSVDAFEGWLIDIIYDDVAAKIENAIITGTALITLFIHRTSIVSPTIKKGADVIIKNPYIVTYLVKLTDHTLTFARVSAHTINALGSSIDLDTSIPGISV